MSRATLRDLQRQVREDAILDMAHELLVTQGYGDMSMDDLAMRVGISKATLYQHFPSKEELAINVIVRGLRRGEEFINSLDPQVPALQRLEYVMRDAVERRASARLAPLMLPPAVVLQHPRFQAQLGRLINMLGAMVDAAKAEGDIEAGLATPIIVRLLLSSIREPSYLDLLQSGKCSVGELSETVITILFDGLRVRRSRASVTPADAIQ